MVSLQLGRRRWLCVGGESTVTCGFGRRRKTTNFEPVARVSELGECAAPTQPCLVAHVVFTEKSSIQAGVALSRASNHRPRKRAINGREMLRRVCRCTACAKPPWRGSVRCVTIFRVAPVTSEPLPRACPRGKIDWRAQDPRAAAMLGGLPHKEGRARLALTQRMSSSSSPRACPDPIPHAAWQRSRALLSLGVSSFVFPLQYVWVDWKCRSLQFTAFDLPVVEDYGLSQELRSDHV